MSTTATPPAPPLPRPPYPALDTPRAEPLPKSPTPGRRRYYYGWVILGVAATAMFMSGPGQSYSMAAFIDPMLADLGLARSQYSLAYLVATLISGSLLPVIGRLLDRKGARLVLPVVAALLGLACLGMSGVGALLGLYLGLTCVRSLGQGALTLVGTWMVSQWFERRRGLAMGLLGLGSTLSFMAFPAGNLAMIEGLGWRGAWVGLGLGVWALLMLPALLLVRNRPEDLGLEPDRIAPPEGAGGSAAGGSYASWTSGQAIRTASFWKVVAALSTSAMVSTGLVFHQVSILGERGLSGGAALSLLTIQAAFACVMSLVGGALADRVAPRRLLATSMALMAVAMTFLLVPVTPGTALIYSALLGLHTGIQRCCGAVTLAGFFGRGHFGSIKGIAMSLVIGASALGPLPLALAKDLLGRYDLALMALMAFPVLAGIAVWSARPPVLPREPAGTAAASA
ncbi:MFS transporter [Tautonia plasticadhaerens]|uniref:L-galactonate transporter n=1 Tax=Tautonia plasticadhaerens TaxID=2527974 RepID=A0A518HCI0_9BACT|nr:MFS transporter [Tautonia plasticadhaerens]QDV38547.1 L-galactonate transporter [Tautonia plasticadhaerens]